MRLLQIVGFFFTIAGVSAGYLQLAMVDIETTTASASAVGLSLLFFVLPSLLCAALMLVPSSIALFSHDLRARTHFKGHFWLTLWKLNLLLSAGYIAVICYLSYIFLIVSLGGEP